ncbi:ABC transporter permease [Actinomyces marmotae]|uniref:ABC transporter permease n=1 Tax=Actinomyces marmotae TaxID=2737173 RepID=A0A6M8B6T3_9ACTO|nr:ABC transporter permease [Actinomyces marmotae]QKD80270.1 ABC transporter permease [Actinomyces marmotae]
MTFWQQARFAIARRRTKSLVLALIITLISAVFVLQGVITSTLSTVTAVAENQVTPGFTVTSPAGDFNQDAADSLLSTPHVVGHNFTLLSSAEDADGNFQSVVGVSDLSRLQAFEQKELELTEGADDAIAKLRDGRGAVLSDSDAASHKLKVGDELTLKKNEETVKLTVVGIYKTTENAQRGQEAPIYTDLRSAQQLAGKDAVSTATFYTDSREHLDMTLKEAKANLAEGLNLKDNTSAVAGVLDSVAGLTTLISRLLWAVLAAGAAILIFVLAFWTRSRIHEVGVLLSIGHSKRRLFAQFIAELLMLTIPSFFVGLVISEVIGYFISNYVLDAVSTSAVGDVSVPAGALVAAAAFSFVAVLAIVVASLLIAMIPILRLQPKQILAKMS